MKASLNETSHHRPNKRRRTSSPAREQSSLQLATSFPFAHLPRDCQLIIIQYLSSEDLNDFAIVSQYCCDLRSDKSLPQTRTGTIHIKRRMDITQFLLALDSTKHSFENNPRRTRLKLTPVSRIGVLMLNQATMSAYSNTQLLNVTSLDMSFSPADRNRNVNHRLLKPLMYFLPNLRELDMSNFGSSLALDAFCTRLSEIAFHCHDIESFRHDGAFIPYSGQTSLNHFKNLKELYLDDALVCLVGFLPGGFLLSSCNNKLERVSLKNATVTAGMSISLRKPPRRLADSELMKFVLATPSLKWLRSDLSPESVAILQQQRPAIQFVS